MYVFISVCFTAKLNDENIKENSSGRRKIISDRISNAVKEMK